MMKKSKSQMLKRIKKLKVRKESANQMVKNNQDH